MSLLKLQEELGIDNSLILDLTLLVTKLYQDPPPMWKEEEGPKYQSHYKGCSPMRSIEWAYRANIWSPFSFKRPETGVTCAEIATFALHSILLNIWIMSSSTSTPIPRTSRKQPCRYLKEQQVQPQPRYECSQDQCEKDNAKSTRPMLPPALVKPVVPYTFPCSRSQEEPFYISQEDNAEASLMSSVAELVHDIIPQSTNPQTVPERIEWVNIQKCSNVNDRKRVVDVVVIGLVRGYQIWARMENGDCREILSERQGPLRTGLLLSTDCEPSFGIHNDRFKGLRPLFALVDENVQIPERQCCTVSFVSLLNAQFVHKINFADSVQTLAASTKIFVASFADHIVILDMMSLREQRTICNTQIYEGVATPFDISDIFLAFANSELQQEYQSCGGMGGEDIFQDSSSYSVVSVARNFTKTLTSFGSSVVSTLSTSQHSKELLSSVAQPGIITVVDVNKFPVDNVISNAEYADAVVAHFVAHTEPIGFIAFGNGGQLLVTSGQSSTYFHVFLIHPHPGSSLLGAVRHLYRLYRGTTPAKVVSCSFSVDNRWLAIATNHGTTHIFGICPYGGQVTVRTHGGEIISPFCWFTGNGLYSCKKASETRGPQFSGAQKIIMTPFKHREHPGISRCNIARSVSNPRIGPYPNPIGMEAHVRIKQRFYSADNLSAWASDMTPTSLSSGKKHYKASSKPNDQHRLAISFASNSLPNSKSTSLLVINNDGILTEYLLSVIPAQFHGASGIFSPNVQQRSNPDETLIQCTPTAVAQWTLQRNKLSADFRAPICERNPLWMWFIPHTVEEEKNDEEANAKWISQIEVLTYLDPHRRLWMGPQFSFRTYIQSLEHASADLITPGSSESRLRGGITKSVPVIIEAAGSLGSFDTGEPTEIIGGSLSSDLDPKDIKRQKVLEKKIEEAMHELTTDGESSGLQTKDSDTSSENSQESTGSSSHDSINFQLRNMDI
ncbi:Breast carcinoma amplified sequence 3 [Dirofilaria immitis]|nr:Breast carcinoma amplified sequence 3 [Dirofilaria immitis]